MSIDEEVRLLREIVKEIRYALASLAARGVPCPPQDISFPSIDALLARFDADDREQRGEA